MQTTGNLAFLAPGVGRRTKCTNHKPAYLREAHVKIVDSKVIQYTCRNCGWIGEFILPKPKPQQDPGKSPRSKKF